MSIMSTATITETRAGHLHTVEQGHELETLDADGQRLSSSAQDEAKVPIFKVFTAGFSFFCAGVDGGTLGPLIPYIIKSFTIGTGDVAIMQAHTPLPYKSI